MPTVLEQLRNKQSRWFISRSYSFKIGTMYAWKPLFTLEVPVLNKFQISYTEHRFRMWKHLNSMHTFITWNVQYANLTLLFAWWCSETVFPKVYRIEMLYSRSKMAKALYRFFLMKQTTGFVLPLQVIKYHLNECLIFKGAWKVLEMYKFLKTP